MVYDPTLETWLSIIILVLLFAKQAHIVMQHLRTTTIFPTSTCQPRPRQEGGPWAVASQGGTQVFVVCLVLLTYHFSIVVAARTTVVLGLVPLVVALNGMYLVIYSLQCTGKIGAKFGEDLLARVEALDLVGNFICPHEGGPCLQSLVVVLAKTLRILA